METTTSGYYFWAVSNDNIIMKYSYKSCYLFSGHLKQIFESTARFKVRRSSEICCIRQNSLLWHLEYVKNCSCWIDKFFDVGKRPWPIQDQWATLHPDWSAGSRPINFLNFREKFDIHHSVSVWSAENLKNDETSNTFNTCLRLQFCMFVTFFYLLLLRLQLRKSQ